VPHVVVHHRREVVDRSRPGGDQPASGVIRAEEDVGDGVPELLAGVRRVHDGRHVLGGPGDRVGEAREQNDDRARIRRVHRANERRVGVGLVGGDELAERAGVGAHDAVLAPEALRDLAQHRVGGARDGVVRVVGGHERARAAEDDRRAKRRPVVLVKEAIVEIRGRVAAAVLVAVRDEVLEERRRSPGSRVVALQTANEGRGHRTGEVRILAVALLAATPARVSGEIGVGRAHDESAPPARVKDPARFDGLDARHLPHDLGVPGLAATPRHARRREGTAPLLPRSRGSPIHPCE
jgi:hypothetical protein